MIRMTTRHYRSVADFWNRPQHAAYLFVAPVILIMVIFTIIPMIASFIFAMTNIDMFLTNIKFIGLDNFLEAFRDERFVNSLGISFKFTLMAVPLRMVVSLFIAVLLTENTVFNKIMRTVYFLPVICSSTVIGIMWELTLNGYVGLIPYWLTLIGLPRIDVFHNTQLALPAIGFMTIWGSFGMTAIIFLAAIKAVPYELYESAVMDGAGSWTRFYKITLPDIMPTFWFLLITNIIGSLQVFDLIYVVTDGGPQYATETTVAYTFYCAFTKYKLGYAAAQSVIFFIIIMVITILLNVIMNRQERND